VSLLPFATGVRRQTDAAIRIIGSSIVPFAEIGPIAVHLPDAVETNDDLQAEHPEWDIPQIFEKTGIAARHVAADDECSSDLGVAAAEKLFTEHDIDRESIDFLLFCTQTPDYPLPTTACLVQQRLGLPTTIGALDYNLGCSGFVYGLAMADLPESPAIRALSTRPATTVPCPPPPPSPGPGTR